jgi:hypothetical protein
MYHRKMEKQTHSVKSVKTPKLPELSDDNKRSQPLPGAGLQPANAEQVNANVGQVNPNARQANHNAAQQALVAPAAP